MEVHYVLVNEEKCGNDLEDCLKYDDGVAMFGKLGQ